MQGGLVAPLAALGVRPNHVTFAGFLIAAGSGYLVWEGSLQLAGALYLFGSSLDALDGALARRTGTTSVFGAFFDSLLDRASEGALLLGLAVFLAQAGDHAGVALTVTALSSSFLVSYARARGESLGVIVRSGIAPRTVRVLVLAVGLIAGVPLLALGIVTAISTVTVVQRTVAVFRTPTPD
jgi:CDP-diacylglycerol--glycerol-3-phosphate 3-phosphatidyltransferase